MFIFNVIIWIRRKIGHYIKTEIILASWITLDAHMGGHAFSMMWHISKQQIMCALEEFRRHDGDVWDFFIVIKEDIKVAISHRNIKKSILKVKKIFSGFKVSYI